MFEDCGSRPTVQPAQLQGNSRAGRREAALIPPGGGGPCASGTSSWVPKAKKDAGEEEAMAADAERRDASTLVPARTVMSEHLSQRV